VGVSAAELPLAALNGNGSRPDYVNGARPGVAGQSLPWRPVDPVSACLLYARSPDAPSLPRCTTLRLVADLARAVMQLGPARERPARRITPFVALPSTHGHSEAACLSHSDV